MIKLETPKYLLTIEASNDELKELRTALYSYTEKEFFNSGENPNWKFLVELINTLNIVR